jgi:hypothetical protein
MSFDLSNYSIKIHESIGTPTLKVEVHLGVYELISNFPTLSGMWMWLPSCTFSLHLFMPLLEREPKAKVVT